MPVLASILAKRWQRLHVVNSLAVIFRFTVLSRAGVIGIALSCVVVALTVNAVMLFGLGLGVDIAPSVAFLVVPVAVIFSSLPISIGGWGVREASLSYGLTLFGKAPADAGMVGLALGIGLLLSSLPGGYRRVGAGWEHASDIAFQSHRRNRHERSRSARKTARSQTAHRRGNNRRRGTGGSAFASHRYHARG